MKKKKWKLTDLITYSTTLLLSKNSKKFRGKMPMNNVCRNNNNNKKHRNNVTAAIFFKNKNKYINNMLQS